jgi:hypothetical protein
MKALKVFAVGLAVLFPLAGQAKNKQEASYQDAVLVDFHMVMTGKHCSTFADTEGTVNATTTVAGDTADTTGNVNATTNATTDCFNKNKAVYRVSVGDHIYTVEPYIGADRVAAAMVPTACLAYLLATKKDSVLYGLLPGTHVQMRSEPGGAFYVEVGKRESRYKLMGAQ